MRKKVSTIRFWKRGIQFPRKSRITFLPILQRFADISLSGSAELVALTDEMEMCIPDPSSKIDEERSGEEIGRLINQFLSGLSEEKRLIFMRRYWYTDSIHR